MVVPTLYLNGRALHARALRDFGKAEIRFARARRVRRAAPEPEAERSETGGNEFLPLLSDRRNSLAR